MSETGQGITHISMQNIRSSLHISCDPYHWNTGVAGFRVHPPVTPEELGELSEARVLKDLVFGARPSSTGEMAFGHFKIGEGKYDVPLSKRERQRVLAFGEALARLRNTENPLGLVEFAATQKSGERPEGIILVDMN